MEGLDGSGDEPIMVLSSLSSMAMTKVLVVVMVIGVWVFLVGSK